MKGLSWWNTDVQLILSEDSFSGSSMSGNDHRVWSDSRVAPIYTAAASILILHLHLILVSRPIQKLHAKFFARNTSELHVVYDEQPTTGPGIGAVAKFRKHVHKLGGYTIFTFKLVQLLSCLTLVTLSALTLHDTNWLQIGLLVTYVYSSILAFASLVVQPRHASLATGHLLLILLVAWATYLYRDVWPLATFTLEPIDSSEGWILWMKLTALTIAAVVIPLGIPRQYIPVDPKNPMAVPNPEQTASWFSVIMYNFLDPVIFLAYRVPHLPYDELPPLADYDYSQYLVAQSFPHLDRTIARKRGHIFFALLRVFLKEYSILALMLILTVGSSFATPIGVNRLLNYLETDGHDATVRPWLWIVWLFLGPVVGSITFQWYVFVATRVLVRVQAIITQLVFEHSLRIRMKAEVAETPVVPSPSGSSTAVASSPVSASPDSASIVKVGVEDGEAGSERNEEVRLETSSDTDSSTKKGKDKVKTNEDGESPAITEKPTAPSRGGNLIGKINNLATSDLSNIERGRDFLMIFLSIPVRIVLAVWFLYTILEWSALVGMAAMVLLFPIPGYIAKLLQSNTKEQMKKTDARVQSVTEAMNVIRMIKLFGWEPKVEDQVAEKREDELRYIRRTKLLELVNNNVNFVIPLITMLVTFVTYTLIMKRSLSASKVFSAMDVFDMLREQLYGVFYQLPVMIRAKVSLDRVDEFLTKTELLDGFSNNHAEATFPEHDVVRNVIGIRGAAFTWSNENDGTMTPGINKRNFTLRIDEEAVFKRGCFNLIIGPTGSGKTSLLMALLGEMHYIPSGPDSYVSLPRDGGIAYAAQESWVQNETIRDNILFGSPYDEDRYNKVIHQCALQRDLSLFDANDKTEVGEKGLTLSGGQKARITLARAVYSSAQILLLDDVLAALDIHTSRFIVENCFKGDLIRGRTVLLVTHNVAIASPIADFVIALGTDGQITSQGSLSNVLKSDKKLLAEVEEETQEIEHAEHIVDHAEPDVPVKDQNSDGKLVVAEEIAEGHVGWQALRLLVISIGGKYNILFWSFLCITLFLNAGMDNMLTWYIGYWAQQYRERSPEEVAVIKYLTVYSLLMMFSVTVFCAMFVTWLYGGLRASRSLHQQLIRSVLGTSLRWLDQTPVSRIISRCTQDIQAIDGPILMSLVALLDTTVALLLKFVAVVIFSPIFSIPGILMGLLGGYLGQIYMKAQLSVKREMSNARSPVIGHFGAAIAGLVSIRAYNAQDAIKKESLTRIDKYSRAATAFYNLNRWISIRLDTIGGFFASSLAVYLVYFSNVSPSNIGFSLTMAVGFSSYILWWVRFTNEFEISGNSLERIEQYLTVEQEPKSSPSGVPPAYWPASGELVVERLSARYSPDGPKVLHDISFHIKSGERIGIVGRTGSGKSSLTLSLLRCIYTEGKVFYDGLPTDSINLDALRSNITIIPQIPELLSGSLRQNLDPFDEYDDAVLNDALRAAGLFSLQSDMDEGRITLDSAIASGGGNLSVGQRQILALARAIVRRSKLLILDEATSAIDYETDSIIQTSLRKELDKDVTLLAIAHRLQTIMDADRIMVLDTGRIAEFDTPSKLLENENGLLHALVNESGEKEALYAMAMAASKKVTR